MGPMDNTVMAQVSSTPVARRPRHLTPVGSLSGRFLDDTVDPPNLVFKPDTTPGPDTALWSPPPNVRRR